MAAASAQINTYLNNHYEGMEPEQLILLLYKGALERIEWAIEGVQENNVKKRGENLSRVIAIVSELNASVDPSMNDESTVFLKGLYTAILEELPKVSITNDATILQQTHTYLSRLKDIWEKDVINRGPVIRKAPISKNYDTSGNAGRSFHSFSV